MTGTGHRAAARTDRPPVRWPVFITALSITGLVAAWCLAAPEFAGGVLGKTVSRAADRLGWF